MNVLLEDFSAKQEAPKPAVKTDAAPKHVSLIDPKRNQNVLIALGRFKMTPPQVCSLVLLSTGVQAISLVSCSAMRQVHDFVIVPTQFLQIREAVLTLNEAFLTADNTQKLLNILPTPDEIGTIQAYEGDPNSLGPVETFFSAIAAVPRLEQRLKCWMATLLFDDNVMQIREKIEAIGKGTRAIKASKGFPKSLEVVLAVGNYLNGTSARGGAYGFRLDILSKLNDVKASSRQKGTLLNYIATQIDKIPQCKELVTELNPVHEAAEFSLSQAENDCKTIQLSLNLIKKELEEMEGQPNDVAKAFKTKVGYCRLRLLLVLDYKGSSCTSMSSF